MAYNLVTEITITVAIFTIATFPVASLQPYPLHQTLAAAQPAMNQAINVTQQCPRLGEMLGGISIPSESVCDVVVVRNTTEIMGHNGLVSNTTSSSQSPSNQNVYAMGDFVLLESEMNPVLQILTKSGWTVTGIHNHVILESPKTISVHWETQGDLNTIIGQTKDALAQTSIQGPK
jgi:Domain of Unknown Function (DUF1259)